MELKLFLDKTAAMCGENPKRIVCSEEGVLHIGNDTVSISTKGSVFPELFHGASGNYEARFVTKGETYSLGKVMVRNGRIAPLSKLETELIMLRLRADIADRDREEMKKEIKYLRGIFNTNSLNFLIKGEK